MLGLFGTIHLANRSLQTQRQGVELAGHNLANVNNPAYARQRLQVQTSLALPSALGPVGSGADSVAINQLRNTLVDRQIQTETSVRTALEARQKVLGFAQASLGQQIDRQASGAEGAAAALGVGGQHGLAENLSDFFGAVQSLSSNPTSLAERQILLSKAENLTSQFNQVSARLTNLRSSLNDTIDTDLQSANDTLAAVAKLNTQISASEMGGHGLANDLRDLRQQKLEELAQWVKVDTSAGANGNIDVSIAGVTVVEGSKVTDTLESFDAGNGQLLVRAKADGTPLALTGGSIQGNIEVRDNDLAKLQANIDTFAGTLVAEVNAIHRQGFNLNQATGEDFFTGTDAATIQINGNLRDNPAAIQAAGLSGAVGDNQTILALAQLAQKKIPALGNQTLNESYGQTVAGLGQALSSTNNQLTNQQIVENMLNLQRDSISGVSIDEEMTDLIKYQKAFEASARLISTIDQMLDTVLNLKR